MQAAAKQSRISTVEHDDKVKWLICFQNYTICSDTLQNRVR